MSIKSNSNFPFKKFKEDIKEDFLFIPKPNPPRRSSRGSGGGDLASTLCCLGICASICCCCAACCCDSDEEKKGNNVVIVQGAPGVPVQGQVYQGQVVTAQGQVYNQGYNQNVVYNQAAYTQGVVYNQNAYPQNYQYGNGQVVYSNVNVK
jgi:hypothetical protein